jgi:N-acetylneuraminate synthase/N,N'-diacetyllegionaminate synthase
MRIGERTIGAGHACFIVAEAGVNHNGDLEQAKRLVDAAAEAGADAIKFQSFQAESLASSDAPKAVYQIARTGREGSQREMLHALELSRPAHEALSRHAHERGILFCSTPFDLASADLLVEIGVPFFKVSSGDLTHIPLLRHLARTGKPIVLSTGMADLNEVGSALDVLRAAGARDVALLHCVTEYPAPGAEANLRAMGSMRERFAVPVGYSDHTLGLQVALAAVALGACILEKHLTLDRAQPGPDHHASLEPEEFRQLVREVRAVEASLGDGVKRPAPSEVANRAVARRSVFAAVDIHKGTVLAAEMLVCKRPEDGIPASRFDAVVGRSARSDIHAGDKLTWDQIE